MNFCTNEWLYTLSKRHSLGVGMEKKVWWSLEGMGKIEVFLGESCDLGLSHHLIWTLLSKVILFFFLIYLLIWLHRVLVVAHGIFSCTMWVLVPWGIEPGPPALGVWSLSHWTPREVPKLLLFQRSSALGIWLSSYLCDQSFFLSP